jgi:hypothetical protein
LDDSGGLTGLTWWLLPVMDRSNHKRQARTANDIAEHTKLARDMCGLGDGQVVVAYCTQGQRLVLQPDPDQPGVLGLRSFHQQGDGPLFDLGVRLGQQEPGSYPPEAPGAERGDLPAFTDHPDPVATGSVRRSANTCPGFGQQRGWEYTSAIYGLGRPTRASVPVVYRPRRGGQPLRGAVRLGVVKPRLADTSRT